MNLKEGLIVLEESSTEKLDTKDYAIDIVWEMWVKLNYSLKPVSLPPAIRIEYYIG